VSTEEGRAKCCNPRRAKLTRRPTRRYSDLMTNVLLSKQNQATSTQMLILTQADGTTGTFQVEERSELHVSLSARASERAGRRAGGRLGERASLAPDRKRVFFSRAPARAEAFSFAPALVPPPPPPPFPPPSPPTNAHGTLLRRAARTCTRC
jgi:hypothetical protein